MFSPPEHQRGLFSPLDMQAVGLPRVVLGRLVASGQLSKVARGLYRLPEVQTTETEGLAVVAHQAPTPRVLKCWSEATPPCGYTVWLKR